MPKSGRRCRSTSPWNVHHLEGFFPIVTSVHLRPCVLLRLVSINLCAQSHVVYRLELLVFLLFSPFLACVTAACGLNSAPSSHSMPKQQAGQYCELEGHATAMSPCVKPYRQASACPISDLATKSTVQYPGNGHFHALAIGFSHASFTIESFSLTLSRKS